MIRRTDKLKFLRKNSEGGYKIKNLVTHALSSSRSFSKLLNGNSTWVTLLETVGTKCYETLIVKNFA